MVRIATLGLGLAALPLTTAIHLAYIVGKPTLVLVDLIEDLQEARRYGHASA